MFRYTSCLVCVFDQHCVKVVTILSPSPDSGLQFGIGTEEVVMAYIKILHLQKKLVEGKQQCHYKNVIWSSTWPTATPMDVYRDLQDLNQRSW